MRMPMLEGLEARRLLSIAAVGAPVRLHGGGGGWDQVASTDVDILTSGGFVVAWTNGPRDVGADGVWAQRFTRRGKPDSKPMLVDGDAYAHEPSVAANDGGAFVVAWRGFAQDRRPKDGSDVFARQFSGTHAAGPAFKVNTFTRRDQNSPSVAVNARGDFVIAWASVLPGKYPEESDVYAVPFDPSGRRRGADVPVARSAPYSGPQAAIDDEGKFLVAWLHDEEVAEGLLLGFVHFRRFDAAGRAQGGEARGGYSDGWKPVAMQGSGAFAVAIEDGEYPKVQRYRASGEPLGEPIETYPDDRSDGTYNPFVAAAPNGRFAVVWNQVGDGMDPLVFRRFDASGQPDTERVQITRPLEYGILLDAMLDDDGNLTAVWNNEDGKGIFTQRFEAVPEPATLDGVAWHDADYDGRRDADEAPMDGVLVRLLGSGDVPAGSAVTDDDGRYRFEDLRPGEYRIRFSAWQGMITTRRDVGADNSTESDIDPKGFTETFTLAPGEHESGHDAGFLEGSTISGRVFHEEAHDGTPDFEDGLTGWLVFVDADGDGRHDPGELADSTDADGYYSVERLRPGRYTIAVARQPFATPTTPQSRQITLAPEESAEADFGQTIRLTSRTFAPIGEAFEVAGGDVNHLFPVAARAPDGRFVLVWSSTPGHDSPNALTGRLYSAGGKPLGRSIRIVPASGAIVPAHEVAMNANGDFVVAWAQLPDEDSEQMDIYARQYRADGAPRGPAFLVSRDGYEPAVAIDADGRFIVAWKHGLFDDDEDAVFVRRYDPQGGRRGDRILITRDPILQPFRIAMDATGRFAVAWGFEVGFDEEIEQWVSGTKVRLYTAGGSPRGPEIRVNPLDRGPVADVAMSASGQFIVAWQDDVGDEQDQVQRFAPDGTPIGGAIELGSGPGNEVKVAMDGEGNFVAAYYEYVAGVPSFFAQRYHAAGIREGEALLAGTAGADDWIGFDVASDGQGNFLVTWDPSEGRRTRIRARLFVASAAPPPD